MKKLKIILGPNDPKPVVLTFDENPGPVLTFACNEGGFTCLLITSRDKDTVYYIESKISELRTSVENDCYGTKVNVDPELGVTYAVFGDYCILNK